MQLRELKVKNLYACMYNLCSVIGTKEFKVQNFFEPIVISSWGGTSLWGKTGMCAKFFLGSFWPENSGIGRYFYWKISVIGVYFHLEFSGIGVYCYTQILVLGVE